jgi:hypothetical protein
VKDHFPSKDGPNVARSRLRRITFLTEEDYLEQLAKRKSRLVRKLRTIYRQERASHDVVSQLSPDSGSFQQTCMLEAVRQGLVQERLAVVTDRIGFLLDDLAANKIAAEADVIALQGLQQQLQTISTESVETAAVQLSRLAQAADGEPLDASVAAQTINVASRQIASLVLQLGVNEATEVLARELQTVIQTQSANRPCDWRRLMPRTGRFPPTRWQNNRKPWAVSSPNSLPSCLRIPITLAPRWPHCAFRGWSRTCALPVSKQIWPRPRR